MPWLLQTPYSTVLQNLGATVIAPLVVGQILQYVLPKQVAWLAVRALCRLVLRAPMLKAKHLWALPCRRMSTLARCPTS